MIKLERIKEFEWDEGNLDKNYQKHGITPKEAEELFLDENLLLVEDINHSEIEERLIAIGKTSQDQLLFAVFTVRKRKIRIISVRRADQKERRQYEKT